MLSYLLTYFAAVTS